MILDRFPATRSFKLIAWVAVAVGWVTTLFTRAAMAPAETAVVSDPARTAVIAESDAVSGVPNVPSTGLVVIRHTPTEPGSGQAQDPVVRTVTVTRVVQAPPVTTSSGS